MAAGREMPRKGQTVTITDLTREHFNGAEATVLHYEKETGRCRVRLNVAPWCTIKVPVEACSAGGGSEKPRTGVSEQWDAALWKPRRVLKPEALHVAELKPLPEPPLAREPPKPVAKPFVPKEYYKELRALAKDGTHAEVPRQRKLVDIVKPRRLKKIGPTLDPVPSRELVQILYEYESQNVAQVQNEWMYRSPDGDNPTLEAVKRAAVLVNVASKFSAGAAPIQRGGGGGKKDTSKLLRQCTDALKASEEAAARHERGSTGEEVPVTSERKDADLAMLDAKTKMEMSRLEMLEAFKAAEAVELPEAQGISDLEAKMEERLDEVDVSHYFLEPAPMPEEPPEWEEPTWEESAYYPPEFESSHARWQDSGDFESSSHKFEGEMTLRPEQLHRRDEDDEFEGEFEGEFEEPHGAEATPGASAQLPLGEPPPAVAADEPPPAEPDSDAESDEFEESD